MMACSSRTRKGRATRIVRARVSSEENSLARLCRWCSARRSSHIHGCDRDGWGNSQEGNDGEKALVRATAKLEWISRQFREVSQIAF
jgi:hypothetical protein